MRLQGDATEQELAHFHELGDANLAAIEVIPLDRIVLKRAGGPFPTSLKTLDAIHLATPLLWYDHAGDITYLTHNRKLATAVRACGLKLRVCPPPV
jgi:hypothetical protein